MHAYDHEGEMVRIPGLYRHWELPQILQMREAFRIEAAGSHEDGTPLLAVFSSCDGAAAQVVARLWTQAHDNTAAMDATRPQTAT